MEPENLVVTYRDESARDYSHPVSLFLYALASPLLVTARQVDKSAAGAASAVPLLVEGSMQGWRVPLAVPEAERCGQLLRQVC